MSIRNKAANPRGNLMQKQKTMLMAKKEPNTADPAIAVSLMMEMMNTAMLSIPRMMSMVAVMIVPVYMEKQQQQELNLTIYSLFYL